MGSDTIHSIRPASVGGKGRRSRIGRGARFVGAAALLAGTLVAGTASPASSQTADPADSLTLNQLQMLGSHNSFHIAPELGLYNFMTTVAASFGQDPKDLLYTHAPLIDQFTGEGIRQIELDVFADPDGGKYAEPVANVLDTFPDYTDDYEPWLKGELLEPGMKVLHIQDFDMKTTCLSLISCLSQVKAFSDANPQHVPIAILIEGKEDILPSTAGITFEEPLPFTSALLDDLDAEIRSVFGEDQLFTPDDLRGTHATLDEAVTTDGWPTLGAMRGKVMFMMDNEGSMKTNYLSGHPTLEGRVLFTSSAPGNPDAAFVKLNDPIGQASAITAAVNAGYVVRTRADGPTDTIETGDTTQRDAAFASGAPWVSTDYPIAGLSTALNSTYGTSFVDYSAPLPGGGIARCNPVTAPDCGFDVTEPEVVAPTTTTTTTAPAATTTTTEPGATTTTAPTSGSTTTTTAAVMSTTTTTASGPKGVVSPRFTG